MVACRPRRSVAVPCWPGAGTSRVGLASKPRPGRCAVLWLPRPPLAMANLDVQRATRVEQALEVAPCRHSQARAWR